MSPQLLWVVAVYFVPFGALMLAALGMEIFERVSEWLDHRRRERALRLLTEEAQAQGWYGPDAPTLDEVVSTDPPTSEDPPSDAIGPRDNSVEVDKCSTCMSEDDS